MWQVLQFLENSSFAIWVRETQSVLAYPTVLAFHAFGMALVVGLSVMIALRIVGFASGLPLAPMQRFFRLIYIGFWINAVSGVVLLILAATSFLTNPVMYIKLLAIAGAAASQAHRRDVVVSLVRSHLFWPADTVGPGLIPKLPPDRHFGISLFEEVSCRS